MLGKLALPNLVEKLLEQLSVDLLISNLPLKDSSDEARDFRPGVFDRTMERIGLAGMRRRIFKDADDHPGQVVGRNRRMASGSEGGEYFISPNHWCQT